MALLDLNNSVSLKNTLQHRLAHRVKLANFFSLPEYSFSELVQRVEKDPLFIHYKHQVTTSERLFAFQRNPRASISTRFLEINESQISAPSRDSLADHYLDEKREIIDLCKKIGVSKFQEYFLYDDKSMSLEEIASECDLTVEAAQKIYELVNKVALDEEFEGRALTGSSEAIEHYSKIAQIDKEPSGDLVIKYNSLRYARGRYVIDYEKFETMKKSLRNSKEELRQLQRLIETMELINTRKSIISRTLEKIIDRQRQFFLTKDPGQLNTLTQLDLARELEVHSSTLCRTIYGKSIDTPWKEEIPIKFFFIRSPSHRIKAALYMIVDQEQKKILEGTLQEPYRDDEIKNLIGIDYHMPVAVRTIAKYREELGIDNVYNRAKAYNNFDKNEPTV